LASRAFDFNFHIGRKHALYRFVREIGGFVQDVGGEEDTQLNQGNSSPAVDTGLSNPLDAVSLLEPYDDRKELKNGCSNAGMMMPGC
jgi:hypothetical protein